MIQFRTWRRLRNLRHHLWMSADDLLRLQQAKLRRLVAHAYAQVPYYRRLFNDAGVKPEQIQTLDDLRRIPITRKETYRETPRNDRLAENVLKVRLLSRRTSGSTGIPLEVHLTEEEYAVHALLTLRSELEVGVHLRHHITIVDSLYPDLRPRWFERLGILRKSYVDLWATLPDQIAQLRLLRPDVLISYATHLRLLAEYARTNGITDLRFDTVFTTSEPAPEEARALIRETFRTKVHTRYDAWETFLIGWECERHEGWHIEADHLILEFLRDGKPTIGPGEVVVTNLDLYAMPIVRYALDDIATLNQEPCPCGRSFPRIQALHGRAPDIIRLPGGRTLDMLVANTVFKQMDGVMQYRLVQEAPDAFRLEIVPAPDFSLSLVAAIGDRFREHCGRNLSLRVEMVCDIPQGPSGKRRYLVSELDGPAAV